MSAAHTPGPWETNGDPVVFSNTRTCIAFTDAPRMTADEAKANARLIAAAPELLDALLWCKSQGWARYTHRIKGQNDTFCDAVDRMNAAIAKATGANQ